MNKIEFGDCRETMRRWAAEGVKVQTCVTSPPYFGLRDYGHEGQIGLEQTPEEYIAAMVDVFRCVRDVLADDGTLWLNLGDSFGQGKQLHGIPWRVSFALQADGWILRQDIIWHKPNPMPESVRDRCTKAHEYIFLLSKSERYFFDSEAMKEDAIHSNRTAGNKNPQKGTGISGMEIRGGLLAAQQKVYEKRNRRSVWTVATRPYKGAHFATFPPDLIEPCILAGSSEKGHCPECGARWSRIVERAKPPVVENSDLNRYGDGSAGIHRKVGQAYQNWLNENPKITIGWKPACNCGHDPVPDIVLDPFMGSGTTAQVALQHGRQYLGCELNPEYKALQDERIAKAQDAVTEQTAQLSLAV